MVNAKGTYQTYFLLTFCWMSQINYSRIMPGPPGLYTLFLNYFVVLYLCYLHSLTSSYFGSQKRSFSVCFHLTIKNPYGALDCTEMLTGSQTFWIVTLCPVQHFLGCNLHTRPLLEKAGAKFEIAKCFCGIFNFLDSPLSLQSFHDFSYTLKQFDKINQKF